MDAKMKKKWVEALRSGKYRQGRGRLVKKKSRNSEYQYCCLGILLLVNGWKPERVPGLELPCSHPEAHRMAKRKNGKLVSFHECLLPEDVRREMGVKYCEQDVLVDLNDGRKRFSTIANWIEENL